MASHGCAQRRNYVRLQQRGPRHQGHHPPARQWAARPNHPHLLQQPAPGQRHRAPDGASTSFEYHPSGELKRTYGARTYPVGYSYDYAGRLKTMTNWTTFASGAGARFTTWNYDLYRGWLTNKTYAGGVTGPDYTYTPGGRLLTRTWARIGTQV